eukprot:8332704-Heterocapsa_arctica.AAC.1
MRTQKTRMSCSTERVPVGGRIEMSKAAPMCNKDRSRPSGGRHSGPSSPIGCTCPSVCGHKLQLLLEDRNAHVEVAHVLLGGVPKRAAMPPDIEFLGGVPKRATMPLDS